jgi:transglutaminase-like putative cysteine protease
VGGGARAVYAEAGAEEMIDQVLALQDWFVGGEGGFTYDLDVPALRGEEALERFVLEDKVGYCEYFATAMAVMLRETGIPARVAVGFLPGEVTRPASADNELTEFTVSTSDAHAWVEVYLDDEGWVRVDPTGAVAPHRIEQGADALGVEEGRAVGALRGIPLLNRLRLQWDDINNRWNLFVLGYDSAQQVRLMERLGFRDAGYRTLVIDCDLRAPVLHRVFSTDSRDGLTSLLLKERERGNGRARIS